MASRLFQQFHGMLDKGVVFIAGKLSIAANAAVSSQSIMGGVFTKTGTGEYTLTLDDTYVGLLSAQATVLAATAVDLVPQIKSADVTSAKTIVFNLNAGATPTNPSAVCELHVFIALKNSTAK